MGGAPGRRPTGRLVGGSMHVVSLPGAIGSRCPLSGVAQQAKQVPAYADDPNQRDKGGWADAGKKEKLQLQLYNKEKKGHARTIRLCVWTYGFPLESMSA